MKLQDKLDAFKAEFTKKTPAEVVAVMNEATEAMKATATADRGPRTGAKWPEFALPNQDGQVVRASELLTNGSLVVSFFRGHWCPYCNTELKALAEAAPDFAEAGAYMVAISPQTVEHVRETHKKLDLPFDVLSDAHGDFSQTLGLRFTLPEDLQAIYKSFGIDLPAFNGDDSWTLPMAARFVVGPDGMIIHADVNHDYTIRPEPQDTLAHVRALTPA
ncbi:MAG: peroxiredoxin-like family protein [Maricaulaceae bacterium]